MKSHDSICDISISDSGSQLLDKVSFYIGVEARLVSVFQLPVHTCNYMSACAEFKTSYIHGPFMVELCIKGLLARSTCMYYNCDWIAIVLHEQ